MADYIEDAEDMVHLHLNATQNVLLSHDLIFSLIAAVSAVSPTVGRTGIHGNFPRSCLLLVLS